MTHNNTQDFATLTHALLDAHGAELLTLVRRSIDHTLQTGDALHADVAEVSPAIATIGACFVTLNNKEGHLRGCIGSPEAWRPLATDVVANANGAAFHDPRFPPLSVDECDGLSVHLSVLSPQQPMEFTDEAGLLAQLVPGTDGLVINDHGQGALFLPAVWAQLPEPKAFLQHLKSKSGMDPDHWSSGFKAWRFIAAETEAEWADIA